MSSVIHNRIALLPLLIVGVAIASHAFMPAAAFADKGGIPHNKGNKDDDKKDYFGDDSFPGNGHHYGNKHYRSDSGSTDDYYNNNDYQGPKYYHYKKHDHKDHRGDEDQGYYNHEKKFFKYKHDSDYYDNVKIIIHLDNYDKDYRGSGYYTHYGYNNEDNDNSNDEPTYFKFYDQHFEDHMYDEEGRFYYDDDGNEYQCDDYYQGSVYYDYNGAFYKCDDLTASEDFEAGY
jgi:hypothetical protein